MATFREKLNSRKLALATACILLATGLLIADIIQAEHWVTVVITVASAYLGAQAYVDRSHPRKPRRSMDYAMQRSREDY